MMRFFVIYIAPWLSGISIVIAVNFVDTRVFPVVTVFTVDSLEVSADGAKIEGRLYKARGECEFQGAVAIVNHLDSTPIRFLDRPPGSMVYSRASGWQRYGPWLIDHPQVRDLRIVSTHQCHRLWRHVTDLLDMDVRGAQ